MTTAQGHRSNEDLIAFATGRAGGSEIEQISDHLTSCAQCRSAALQLLHRGGASRELVLNIVRNEEEPEAAVPPVPLHQHRRQLIGIAAAAAFAAVGLTMFFASRLPRHTAAIVRSTPAAPSWRRDVDAAIAHGLSVPPAAWSSLPRERGSLRGPSLAPPPIRIVAPYGDVVEEIRPAFEWTEVSGAAYVVSVVDGVNVVASSGPITATRWQASHDLVPGRTYTWQVVVLTGEGRRVIPAPPDPPARFTVLDANARAALARIRAAAPNHHLVLGVAAANAGLRQTADEEFSRVPLSSPDHAAAVRFQNDLRQWDEAPGRR